MTQKTGRKPGDTIWMLNTTVKAAINDVPAQSDFYSPACGKWLRDLVRDAEQGDVVARLLKVWQQKLSYRLVRAAEESKIALSASPAHTASLDFIAAAL